jgi:hypothetical protein
MHFFAKFVLKSVQYSCTSDHHYKTNYVVCDQLKYGVLVLICPMLLGS